ncbi:MULTISPECIES: hypothetical protein [Synechococcaceae]|uniref:hypothetical protein n=1 Tax=Synechococcaceae TaxID=1890426 RepID=UPI00223B3776|nr:MULTISPECIES: hypothetical protein [Synechococcaceae]MCT0201687.1 hypothetical protein [Synechococcus sp. CS-603]MCT4365959.1 hypothetical protein [Candidatus Regnicoccus frigidus MAG-AL1]MCT4366293.1 hypothetical protein [Candidatus Regnicoccus frigidus MAG-AL2]
MTSPLTPHQLQLHRLAAAALVECGEANPDSLRMFAGLMGLLTIDVAATVDPDRGFSLKARAMGARRGLR